jgi:hypothetical protein
MADAVGQVDPVPALFDRIFAQAPLQLAAEDGADVWTAQFRERLYLDGVLQPWPQAGFSVGYLAAFQKRSKPGLGGFDRRFAEPATLEKVQVLLCDRRQQRLLSGVSRQRPAQPVGQRN